MDQSVSRFFEFVSETDPWWRRRVPPPGPNGLITKAVYRHRRLAPTKLNIGFYAGEKKGDASVTHRESAADVKLDY